MSLKITRVVDEGNDILRVYAIDQDDEEKGELTATGWVSALYNHVDDPQPEGSESVVSETREMTLEEKYSYLLSLFEKDKPEQPKEVQLNAD